MDDSSDRSLPHLLVIGGGFAGLWATRALARAPLRITLLDRANHHLFQPCTSLRYRTNVRHTFEHHLLRYTQKSREQQLHAQ